MNFSIFYTVYGISVLLGSPFEKKTKRISWLKKIKLSIDVSADEMQLKTLEKDVLEYRAKLLNNALFGSFDSSRLP